jgi:hypothetical protein
MTQLRLFGIIGLSLMLLTIVGTITTMAKTIEANRAAIAVAIGDPGLSRRQVLKSIERLGRDRAELAALKAQLAGEAQRAATQKVETQKAARASQERASAIGGTVTRLEVSAAAGGAPCEPSATLKGQWK